jgi:hypothetical protein
MMMMIVASKTVTETITLSKICDRVAEDKWCCLCYHLPSN